MCLDGFSLEGFLDFILLTSGLGRYLQISAPRWFTRLQVVPPPIASEETPTLQLIASKKRSSRSLSSAMQLEVRVLLPVAMYYYHI